MTDADIAKQFIEAMMASDTATMQTLLSAAVTWHPPDSVADHFGASIEGIDAVMAFLTENPQAYYEPGSRRAEFLHVIAEGDTVSAHFNFIARPKKGGTLNVGANWVFELSDRQITAVWEILDVAQWNSAVLPD